MCLTVNSSNPYDNPIRVDTVIILTLERKKWRHREVDLGSLSLHLTFLVDYVAFNRCNYTTFYR